MWVSIPKVCRRSLPWKLLLANSTFFSFHHNLLRVELEENNFMLNSILNQNELSDLWFETVSVKKVANKSLSLKIIKFATFHVWHLVTVGTIQDCLRYNCLKIWDGFFELLAQLYQNVLHFNKKKRHKWIVWKHELGALSYLGWAALSNFLTPFNMNRKKVMYNSLRKKKHDLMQSLKSFNSCFNIRSITCITGWHFWGHKPDAKNNFGSLSVLV